MTAPTDTKIAAIIATPAVADAMSVLLADTHGSLFENESIYVRAVLAAAKQSADYHCRYCGAPITDSGLYVNPIR